MMKIKKMLAGITAFTMLMGVTYTVGAESTKISGDIDSDNEITSSDALNILQSVTNIADLTDEQKNLADIDTDGEVTSADALYILQIVVGGNGGSEETAPPQNNNNDGGGAGNVPSLEDFLAGISDDDLSGMADPKLD